MGSSGWVTLSTSPPIALLDGFLSPAECDGIIDDATRYLEYSEVVDDYRSGGVRSRARSGWYSFLPDSARSLVGLAARIEKASGVRRAHTEGFQAIKYGPGDQYRPHFDYFLPDVFPGHRAHIYERGQRIGTFLVYLREPEGGGETEFVEIGIKVKPRVGRALMWRNTRMDGTPNPLTRHAGLPPVRGEKWILTRWLRAGCPDCLIAGFNGPWVGCKAAVS
jgi:prolyl 4-hydroxylase